MPDLSTFFRRPAWQARAARRSQGTDAFITESKDPAPAKALCAGCPVRGECLSFVLDDPELVGVWGGTTGEDRRVLRRASA